MRQLTIALGLAISACTPAKSYFDIPLRTPIADAGLQTLARRAQTGDKQAQLDLGIRFEEGRGVTRDWGRAKRLYRAAAAKTGGTIFVYVPKVGKTPGRVMPVNTGPEIPGLAEAKARLDSLEARER